MILTRDGHEVDEVQICSLSPPGAVLYNPNNSNNSNNPNNPIACFRQVSAVAQGLVLGREDAD